VKSLAITQKAGLTGRIHANDPVIADFNYLYMNNTMQITSDDDRTNVCALVGRLFFYI